jgi:hypothetical protein
MSSATEQRTLCTSNARHFHGMAAYWLGAAGDERRKRDRGEHANCLAQARHAREVAAKYERDAAFYAWLETCEALSAECARQAPRDPGTLRYQPARWDARTRAAADAFDAARARYKAAGGLPNITD